MQGGARLGRAMVAPALEVLVPAGDVVRRRSVSVDGILVKVAGVQVGLNTGHDGGLQAPLPEACNKYIWLKGILP